MSDFNDSARAFHGAFAAPITPAEAKLRAVARAHQGDNPLYERLLALQAKADDGNIVADREITALMTTSRRIELGYYLSGKEAAAEVAKLDAGTRR